MVVNKRKTHLRHLAQARQKGNAHNAANMPSSDSKSDIEAQSYIDNNLDESDIEQQLSQLQFKQLFEAARTSKCALIYTGNSKRNKRRRNASCRRVPADIFEIKLTCEVMKL